MFIYVALHILQVFICLKAASVNDVLPFFGDKDCIEATALGSAEAPNIMLEGEVPEKVRVQSLILANLTQTAIENHHDKTAVSKINELIQYNKLTHSWKLISEEGPAHAKRFAVQLQLGDEVYEGSGSSLKKAQQSAADFALESTNYEHPPIKLKEDKNLTPTVVLNNIASKLAISIKYFLITNDKEESISTHDPLDERFKKNYYESWNETGSFLHVPTEDAQLTGPFKVRVHVDEDIFLGFGHTIQAARHDAAIQALKFLEKQASLKTNVCLNDDTSEECKSKKHAIKSAISRVHEEGQARGLQADFTIISEEGKPHKKVFITRCTLGNYITEGEGKSKKESKRDAAEKMVEIISKLPEVFSENGIVNSLTNKKKKKKKKSKFKKSGLEKITDSFNQVLSSVWDHSDTQQSQQQDNKSPKHKLLKVGNVLKFDVQFSDFDENEGKFYSLVSLGVHPIHVCLGKSGNSQEKSQQSAAIHGLRFLYKSKIFDKIHTILPDEDLSDYLEDFEDEPGIPPYEESNNSF